MSTSRVRSQSRVQPVRLVAAQLAGDDHRKSPLPHHGLNEVHNKFGQSCPAMQFRQIINSDRSLRLARP